MRFVMFAWKIDKFSLGSGIQCVRSVFAESQMIIEYLFKQRRSEEGEGRYATS